MSALQPAQLWIAGKQQPGNGELIPIQDPATGEVFAHCCSASAQDVHEAVEAAQSAFASGVWSERPRDARAAVLERAACLVEAHLPELIALEVRQTGRPVREMQAQVPTLVRWFRYYGALLRTEERPVVPTQGRLHNWLDRRPLGVVAHITPFNHPLLIAVKKAAPALAAGNSVVVKPSELTPLSTLRLAELLAAAGLPPGVFSVLPGYGPGSTGAALVAHPLVRKVDVTCGTAAGRAIGGVAGRNLARFTAELGGNAPLVVFKAAVIDAAVNGIAFGAFVAAGQTCVAATRILVERAIMQPVLDRLAAKADSICRRVGAPTNPRSTMGPLVSQQQLARVDALVRDAVDSGHATLVCGGARLAGTSRLDGTDLAKGFFFAPTVLASTAGGDNDNNSSGILKTRIWREEVFGPVVVVVGFDTEDEAVALANDSEFGLGAAVWTRDLSQAFRVAAQVDAGIVWVNTHHRNDPSSPWGGAKTASGLGCENGIEAYHAYTKIKSTVINYASSTDDYLHHNHDDWFRDWEGAQAAEEGGHVRYS